MKKLNRTNQIVASLLKSIATEDDEGGIQPQHIAAGKKILIALEKMLNDVDNYFGGIGFTITNKVAYHPSKDYNEDYCLGLVIEPEPDCSLLLTTKESNGITRLLNMKIPDCNWYLYTKPKGKRVEIGIYMAVGVVG